MTKNKAFEWRIVAQLYASQAREASVWDPGMNEWSDLAEKNGPGIPETVNVAKVIHGRGCVRTTFRCIMS